MEACFFDGIYYVIWYLGGNIKKTPCINTAYTWSTHFCRKLSFVAITRFLRGTFCSNLVCGGRNIFYWTGPQPLTNASQLYTFLMLYSWIPHLPILRNIWHTPQISKYKKRWEYAYCPSPKSVRVGLQSKSGSVRVYLQELSLIDFRGVGSGQFGYFNFFWTNFLTDFRGAR